MNKGGVTGMVHIHPLQAEQSTVRLVWNVPHPRNPNFAGRADLLTALEAVAVPQTLHGLGGVGKTQLVVEYAYRHAAEFPVVWWLRSEEAATLAADYAELATVLQLPESTLSDQAAIVAAVRGWLESHAGWLLIFDNAAEQASVKDYLPKVAQGRTLITSRNSAWDKLVSVPVLEREASVAFLLKRSGDTDRAAADALANELGDLPLALEHAAAYCGTGKLSLSVYLDLYKKHQLALLVDQPATQTYSVIVAKTWELALRQVAQTAPAGVALLWLCAFFASDTIELADLQAGAEYLPERLRTVVTDVKKLEAALTVLQQYALIQRTATTLLVHRLVQEVTRLSLDETAYREWAGAAVSVIAKAFPGGPGNSPADVQTWDECRRLLGHALTSCAYAVRITAGVAATGRLLNQMGLYFKSRVAYQSAKYCFEQALRLFEKVAGAEQPTIATLANNLGWLLQEMGDYATARAYIEQALRIDEVALGPNHPQVAIFANNLGSLLQTQGDYVTAKQYIEQALRIDEAAFGSNHPNVARDLNNLGSLLQDMGDYATAKPCYERALRITETALGLAHPKVAILANNLGSLLKTLGEYEAALPYYIRALRIDKATLGETHPSTLKVSENLTQLTAQLAEQAKSKKSTDFGAKRPKN